MLCMYLTINSSYLAYCSTAPCLLYSVCCAPCVLCPMCAVLHVCCAPYCAPCVLCSRAASNLFTAMPLENQARLQWAHQQLEGMGAIVRYCAHHAQQWYTARSTYERHSQQKCVHRDIQQMCAQRTAQHTQKWHRQQWHTVHAVEAHSTQAHTSVALRTEMRSAQH